MLAPVRDSLRIFPEQRVRRTRRRAAASVGPGDEFEEVSARVVEVDSAAVVPGVDSAGFAPLRIRPVGKAARAYARENRIELGFGDEECVVLSSDVALGVHEVERQVGVNLHDRERSDMAWRRQAHQLTEEARRDVLVACVNDSVIEMHPDPASCLAPRAR